MKRRELLKFCSVGTLLGLSGGGRVIERVGDSYVLKSLGFSLKYPSNWIVSTVEEQIKLYCGGGDVAEIELPVVLFSQFEEPTDKENSSLSVYAMEPSKVWTTPDEFDIFNEAFHEYLSRDTNYIGNWVGEARKHKGLSLFRFCCDFRATDGTGVFETKMCLYYQRDVPLGFVYSHPKGKEPEGLKEIFDSLTFKTV